MSAIGVITVDQAAGGVVPGEGSHEAMPGGLALSAALHVSLVALIVFGLPSLFAPPPPQETPIAVDLVTIAPETKATHPNPFRPKREAKPEPAIAPPAPKPKPEPPKQPTAAEPPSSAPPPPSSAAPAKPEPKEPPPPPPPPKPAETIAPRLPEPKPHFERQQVREPPRPEAKPADSKAFAKLLDKLEDKKPAPHPQPAAFDALLKNLTRQQTAETEDAPPAPQKMAAAAAPSSQPHAPLGSELTASQKDLIIQQIERCWNVPAGARDAQDLVVEIKAVVNVDGTVNQAMVVDSGRYASDAFFRAAADSAKRAVLNPQCTGPGSPLPVPPDKYEVWHNLDLFFNPKDLL